MQLMAQFLLSWRRLFPVFAMAVLIMIFWSVNERFLSYPNFLNILRQSSVLLIVATGLTFVIILGSIDLSVGAIATLSALISAIVVRDSGFGALGAMAAAIAIGALCGVLNGALVVLGRIPSFVATLGTMTAIGGVSTSITGGRNIMFNDAWMRWLALGSPLGLPNIAVVALLLFGLAAFIGLRTHIGRGIYAVGAGTRAAILAGYDVVRLKFFAFVVSGILAGIGGMMLVARTSSGETRMGDSLMLDALAAVVIGGTAISGGAGGVHLTILGVLVIAVVDNGLNVIGVHPYLQIAISGLLVIAAVAVLIDRERLHFVK